MRLTLTVFFTVIGAAAFLLVATRGFAADPPYGGTAVVSMTATLVDTTGAAIGTVQLHQDAAGVVLVRVDAAGISAGAHGIHIHQTGKCEGPAFASAGAHFNPTNKKHGLDSADGSHGGDLAQVPATFDGSGTHEATTNRISLFGGPLSITDADGSALVIHATADDQLTDRTGNSGGRIACAVIAPATAPLPPATGTGISAAGGPSGSALAGVLVFATAAGLAAARLARRRPPLR